MILRKLCGLLLLLACLRALPAAAQFKIERAREDFFLGQQARQVIFYTNTHFNRVEGLYLNLGAKYRPRQISGLTLFGDLGYAFKNEEGKRWRGNAGFSHRLSLPDQFTFGADYFNRIDTNDDWLVGEWENSLAGIFLHEDFMDYFSRKGVRSFVDYRLLQAHTLRLEFAGYSYEPVRRNSNWSLFGGNKVYAANSRTPFPVVRGNEQSLLFVTAFDWRDNPIFPIYGWYADFQLEQTFGDFSTTGWFVTVKRFQPTFSDQKFQIKLLAGARSGSHAFQHLLPLGGLGNLRGYREKEFIGDRALYLTANYIIGQNWLHHVPLHFIPIWEGVSLGVFAETGLAWFAEPGNPDAGLFDFGNIRLKDFRNDAGISLFVAENVLRVDIAKRLDRGYDDWRVLVRILDKF